MPLTSTPLSRRTFLQGITAALGASAFGFDQFLGDTSRAVAAVGPTLPVGAPVVVVIDLGGGDDILNVHVPIAVPNVT